MQYLHTLPAGLWALLLPVQLHPAVRSRYPILHRGLGYLFVAMALSLSAGVYALFHHKLDYIHNDFPRLVQKLLSAEQGPSLAADWGVLGFITRYTISKDALLMFLLVVWFLGTLFFAIRAARGLSWRALCCCLPPNRDSRTDPNYPLSSTARRFVEHRFWMYRHAASGLWVAVQRLFGEFRNRFVTANTSFHLHPNTRDSTKTRGNIIRLSQIICSYLLLILRPHS